ncbi:transcriptional repressor [Oscillospiraceae bacterium OttesenSCG-928-F05]|nr:transcriptional repressor [Oscillospiraceae bacterium OttesenSCG-928-F05]
MARASAYQTKQQDIILAHLASLGDRHVTAREIAEQLRKAGEPVGLATVYRHLQKLVDAGRVRKYTLDERSGACFQYTEGAPPLCELFHLKCEACGALIHLDCDLLGQIRTHVEARHAFAINAEKTVFYGRCAQCGGAPAEEGI